MPRFEPRFRLGVYVFEQAEILDFAAPYGVFSVAGNLNPGLEVVALGESGDPVTARSGFKVVPARSLEDAGALDALLLPGGPGSRREMHNERLLHFISGLPAHTLLASVCSGALILGHMDSWTDSRPQVARSRIRGASRFRARAWSTCCRRSPHAPASAAPGWSTAGASSLPAERPLGSTWVSIFSGGQAMATRSYRRWPA